MQWSLLCFLQRFLSFVFFCVLTCCDTPQVIYSDLADVPSIVGEVSFFCGVPQVRRIPLTFLSWRSVPVVSRFSVAFHQIVEYLSPSFACL